jgi:hypothetical protein
MSEERTIGETRRAIPTGVKTAIPEIVVSEKKCTGFIIVLNITK